MGDIGTHAHNLLTYISDLQVSQVAAEVGTIVPNRLVHDYAGALLRMSNGARGSFWVTQAAAGVEKCLRIRVSRTRGSVEWMQEIPQVLTFKPLNGPVEIRTPNGQERCRLRRERAGSLRVTLKASTRGSPLPTPMRLRRLLRVAPGSRRTHSHCIFRTPRTGPRCRVCRGNDRIECGQRGVDSVCV